MPYTLNINGQSRAIDAAEDTPLLYVLREELRLLPAAARGSCSRRGPPPR
jgi:aerobic-type carbon monoxide dehydrogenase small subunit (CoxS/CutS family)